MDVNLFNLTFKGRTDAYGTSEKCVKEKVTEELIQKHMEGKLRLGRFPLAPNILNGEGTYWAVADIDIDDIQIVAGYQHALQHLDVPCYVERSKRKGFHCWVFFDEPVRAKQARALMLYAARILERDENYTAEIFPKQNSIKRNDGTFGFGNYLYLPLFGESVKASRTIFLNPKASHSPYLDQWVFLASIEKISREKLEELMDEVEEEVKERSFVTNEVVSASEAGSYYLEKAISRAMIGNRNDTGFWLACQLRDLRLTFSKASELLQIYQKAVPQGDDIYTLQEAFASLRSAYSRPPRAPAYPGR